jgi:hypothetical protein
MFIKLDIQGDIFGIITDLCMHLNNILNTYKISNKNKCYFYYDNETFTINELILIINNISELMTNKTIEQIFINEVSFNPSLNGELSINKIIAPTAERLIELNKYHIIMNDFYVKLYNIKQLLKKEIKVFTEFHINILILMKQIYNYIDEINNLISMLITQPKGIYIITYGQLFNKFLNNKTHIAKTIIYNN